MAGFTSFASTAMSALSLANTALGAVNSYKQDSGLQEYKEAKQKAALDNAALQREAVLKKEANRIDQEASEQDRRNKIRKLMAEQRAKYGSQGIGSGDGSSQAYLYGLLNMSEDEQKREDEAYTIRNKIIDSSLDSDQRVNTLQLTQLKERSKMNRLGALYNSLTSVF